MKYIAAYLLAKLGKENPSIDDIKNIIESVGIEFDEKKANEIIQKLEGKDINEVINDGKSKLTVVSNTQAANVTQQSTSNQQEENKEDKGHEEEESMELGNDLGDLFN